MQAGLRTSTLEMTATQTWKVLSIRVAKRGNSPSQYPASDSSETYFRKLSVKVANFF